MSSLMKTLTYCLDILKIKEDAEVYRNAIELAQRVPIESVNGNDNDIVAIIDCGNAIG